MKKKLNRILLIDDDEVTNFLHQRVLMGEEVCRHIETAETVQEALDLLVPASESETPELIFLDLNMPGLNGWDFIDSYRRYAAEVPSRSVMVVLSASANPDDEQRAESLAEVAEFRRKPLSRQMVHEILEKYFPD